MTEPTKSPDSDPKTPDDEKDVSIESSESQGLASPPSEPDGLPLEASGDLSAEQLLEALAPQVSDEEPDDNADSTPEKTPIDDVDDSDESPQEESGPKESEADIKAELKEDFDADLETELKEDSEFGIDIKEEPKVDVETKINSESDQTGESQIEQQSEMNDVENFTEVESSVASECLPEKTEPPALKPKGKPIDVETSITRGELGYYLVAAIWWTLKDQGRIGNWTARQLHASCPNMKFSTDTDLPFLKLGKDSWDAWSSEVVIHCYEKLQASKCTDPMVLNFWIRAVGGEASDFWDLHRLSVSRQLMAALVERGGNPLKALKL